ncbi:hypothetical protein ACIBQ6_38865 [Nonomuraea sp. NPDC049655]|uniref:hypothetical protein n=1 Tax=Nonomuraea sp. NPDC049655 TaxID=3364355 RepID=UPI00378CED21
MSHKRSGLLPGLIAGLVAALVCAAALGLAVLFQDRLPKAVATLGNGHALSVTLSLLIALLVALAVGAARPRNRALPVVAALYAAAAVAGGQISGVSIILGAARHTSATGTPFSPQIGDITAANAGEGLPRALAVYREPLAQTWQMWLYIAVAAVAALLLVTLRVFRVRRADRAALAAQEAAEEAGQEYRAPFEPAQPPAQSSAQVLAQSPGQQAAPADLFTPRKPARD